MKSTPIPSANMALTARALTVAAVMLALPGCDGTGAFNPSSAFQGDANAEAGQAQETPTEFVEEDVEKPDVFYANETGLWDGRPSLGGVWVAHPDVKQPERVILRNKANGKFVISALFRRERELPGPRLQLSSDAAQAIDVLPGAPVELEVVALRTEKIPVAPPAPTVTPAAETTDGTKQAAENSGETAAEIKETTLDPIAAAEAAIETAPAVAADAVLADANQEPAPEPALPFARMTNPFVQVAVFSVEKNAEQVSEQMRSIGLIPTVKQEDADGKALWRVLIGPASSRSERRELLKKVRAEGYADAYSVPQ